MSKNIYVTQPSLAPIAEFIEHLKPAWETGILTHNGPILQNLEAQLTNKLGVSYLSLVTNGTVALQMAIKALELEGEIITTPFSWVATVSAIKWESCTPIFCDIEPDTFNIDPSKIESLITDKTVAIMPVHVFGVPCDIEAIQAIAHKHGLKVIYDAAHAVGSTYNNQSVFEFGNISATSLHGTKLFNTAEGGACITTSQELDAKLRRIRFFGHDEAKEVIEDGFNGKMTEVHAALGLANLKYYDVVLEDRKTKYLKYLELLNHIPQISFQKTSSGGANYSYFPVVFESEELLINVIKILEGCKIYPRRYFYPSLNSMEKIIKDISYVPNAISISKRILCLPLYYSLSMCEVDRISTIIKKALHDSASNSIDR